MTRLAICGGPYSNPYALRAFVGHARARGADRLFCLGDFGAYGAEPEAIRPLLAENGIECIAGGYEVAIGARRPDRGCGHADDAGNVVPAVAYADTFARTSPEFAAWMATLPTEHRETVDGLDLHLVHGSPLGVDDFWWESLSEQAHQQRVAASGADVICCARTGLPWSRGFVSGDASRQTLVVNVGALGRPANDGGRHVWYGLPEAFAATIETGDWTTCLDSVPPAERSRGRYQLSANALPDVPPAGDPVAIPDNEVPVMPLFGSALFPPRLWIYTNFDCNLACEYCSVASSPRARRRRLGAQRFCELVDEAAREGFTEIYVTGGEPFLEPDLADMLVYASGRLDVVCLTNGMLYQGRRREQLERLAGCHRLTLQTSLDGAEPAAHDTHRGRGSWQRAMRGLDTAVSLGLPVRVGMTETPQNSDQIEPLRELLATKGVRGDDFAVRPLVRRGHSDEGMVIGEDNTIPELTVTADGWHWHPAGADVDTSPDMLLGGPEISMTEAKRRAVETFLTLRQQEGSLPRVYNCAV